MAGFDPAQKFETWVFQKVGERATANGPKMVYRRMPYNLVEYDGSVNQVIEPVALPVGPQSAVNTLDLYGGQVIGWAIEEGRQFEAFAMGEKAI